VPIARVQMPDGRVARLEVPEGTAPAAIEAFVAQNGHELGKKELQMADAGRPEGSDLPSFTPPANAIGLSQAKQYATIPGLNIDVPMPKMAQTAANYLDRTMTPAVVGATVGSMAFPPLAAAGPGVSAIGSLVARFGPNVVASAVGGGLGGGLEESQRPGSTAGSIASTGATDALKMGGAQVAGLGMGALMNKLLAPGLPVTVPPEKREAVKDALYGALQTTKEGAKSVYNALPESITGPIDSVVQSDAAQGAIGLAQKLGVMYDKIPEVLREIPGEHLAERFKWPLLTAALGPHVTIPLYIGDKILNPGKIAEYLSNTKLPSEAVRMAGRETASVPLRGFFDTTTPPWKPRPLGFDAMRSDPTSVSQFAPPVGRSDLADLQALPGSPGTDASQWGLREDGTKKGKGWLGLLRRPDGDVSSELSVGVEIDGKERDIPLLVPTLTRAEIEQILSSDETPRGALDKAIAFARQRIANGQDPFASPAESPQYRRP
jgi:hypothetical protein